MVKDVNEIADLLSICTFKGECPEKWTNAAGSVCTSTSGGKPCTFTQLREDPMAFIAEILNASAPLPPKPVSDSKKLFIVAFDIDMTLIDAGYRPRYHVISLMKWFVDNGNTVHVWSGGGLDYCETWILKLGIDVWGVTAIEKFSIPVDIAVDNMADGIDITEQLNAKVIVKV